MHVCTNKVQDQFKQSTCIFKSRQNQSISEVVPGFASWIKGHYCLACICSWYNATSDWLILGHFSPVMPTSWLWACNNKAKSHILNIVHVLRCQYASNDHLTLFVQRLCFYSILKFKIGTLGACFDKQSHNFKPDRNYLIEVTVL